MKRQIINPYIRYGRRAKGVYANAIGGGQYARPITRGDLPLRPLRGYTGALNCEVGAFDEGFDEGFE